MVASLLEDIFLPMLPPPDFSFGKVAVRNVLLRLWTRLVRELFNYIQNLGRAFQPNFNI
jgi:hypothetical protein